MKAEAVLRAAETLRDAQLANPGESHDAPAARLDSFRATWRLIPGQRSGLSLDYFLMLCGMPGVKGDRMIRRFVAAALGEPNELAVDPARAVSLVQMAASRLGTDDRMLDFAYGSTRAKSGPGIRSILSREDAAIGAAGASAGKRNSPTTHRWPTRRGAALSDPVTEAAATQS